MDILLIRLRCNFKQNRDETQRPILRRMKERIFSIALNTCQCIRLFSFILQFWFPHQTVFAKCEYSNVVNSNQNNLHSEMASNSILGER